MEQSASSYVRLAIRTEADPMLFRSAVRAAVAAVDKNVPLYGVETLDTTLASQVSSQKFNMALLVGFAALASTSFRNRNLRRDGLCRRPAYA